MSTTGSLGVFRGVASRDWPPTGLTTQAWIDTIPPQYVPIRDLYATQPHLHTHALTTTPPPTHGTDDLPHVIHWAGEYYIEDGHHRVLRAALRGHTMIRARVLCLTTTTYAEPTEQPATK